MPISYKLEEIVLQLALQIITILDRLERNSFVINATLTAKLVQGHNMTNALHAKHLSSSITTNVLDALKALLKRQLAASKIQVRN